MFKGEPVVRAHTDVIVSEAMIGMLPPAPSRLLLLGLSVDVIADALRAQSYEVVTAPPSEPLAYAQVPSATREGVYQVDLPALQVGPANFSAILVLDVSPQIHPLALFDQLSHCLLQDGVVLLCGHTARDIHPRVNRWLEYLVAIGERCGFTAVESEGYAPADGVDTFVRAFRKATQPRWRLHHLRAGDYAEIAVLFQAVFEYPLSPELWAWKYADGRGNAVLASRQDGVLIAHYGGIYREILLCGRPEWAYGGSDVMVHPQERGVMTRKGPFLLTAATTAEMYGPVAFGFPTERAMLVAERMGLYTKAGQMVEVRWEPAAPGLRVRTRVRPLSRGNAKDELLVGSLWGAMASDLRAGVVGVRDWKYLQHRYFDHPHNQYEVLAISSRLTGKPLGVVVLRRLEDSCELLDVIAPLCNLVPVIDQARRMTARWGLPYLYCWITTNYASTFVACGGREHALNVFIPTSCWTDDPRVEMLKDKWWLMSGDTDFR